MATKSRFCHLAAKSTVRVAELEDEPFLIAPVGRRSKHLRPRHGPVPRRGYQRADQPGGKRGSTQVACFDTAFHRDHPAQADCYALPRALYEEGIRRYGFHGLSYEYIASRLAELAPEIAGGRVIVAHLGSGASMCAVAAGRSIESTMGFTALDGLVMGTRPGQLDPGVILHLIEQRGMAPADVTTLLCKASGLKGLSGVSNDMRDLLASDAPGAASQHLNSGHSASRARLAWLD